MAPVLTMDEEKQVGLEKEAIRLGRLLLSRWWMILVAGILIALAAWGYTAYRAENEKPYQASAKLYVQIEDKTTNLSNNDAASKRVDSYRIVLKSRETLKRVIEELKADSNGSLVLSVGQLSGMVSTNVEGETEIFTVTVTMNDNKILPVSITNAIVKVMKERIPELFGSSAKVGVVDNPDITAQPVAPSYRRAVIIGFIVGAILCCVGIVALDLLNDRLKSEDWLTQTYGGEIPVLASIPDTQTGNSSRGYRYYSYRRYGYYYGYGSRSGKRK